jgi:hypothetical protein
VPFPRLNSIQIHATFFKECGISKLIGDALKGKCIEYIIRISLILNGKKPDMAKYSKINEKGKKRRGKGWKGSIYTPNL